MDNEHNTPMQVDPSTNTMSALQAFKLDPSMEWVIKSVPEFVAIKHKMGCSICDASASHCMATKRSYEICLSEKDVSHTVAEAWPELVRYQDDYYRLLEDYNALKEKIQSAEKKAEDCRAKMNELYEKLNTHRSNPVGLPKHEELVLENKHLQQELDYYVGRAQYALYGKDADWAICNGYRLGDIPDSDSKDDDEDHGGLPMLPEEIPQDVPVRPPTKLAHKSHQNESKVVHEAGIPPGFLETFVSKPKFRDAEAELLLQSIFSTVVKWDQMITGQWKRNDSLFLCSPTPARYQINHNQKFNRRAFAYWLGCDTGVTPALAQDKLKPYFVRRATKTIWNEVTLRSQLRANEIASLKGNPMNQFRVHDDLLPLVRESPYYFPPSVGEPMDQDEVDPEPNPIQHTTGSSSLADRLDYGEGGSFSHPPADAHELRAQVSYFNSLVPQGTAHESTAEITEALTRDMYVDNHE
ncbi:hypothetical protein M422DRAFT_259449 [Sphaerobolus stellatus SS14]|uniref:Uncharacterized protein n=1 Tax=Sphaerobolus stellatus (strain SS14) TaxID=990650 RepID=A0A0C9UT47_SPHS4|nr:hypothetical protein M422DRAFT_259449 [Sphaerobolus stellatus SS14]